MTMAWTFKMRMTSIAVTIYVALAEYSLVAIPVCIVLWFAGAKGARLMSVGSELAAVWALVIVVVSHARPFASRTQARARSEQV
jgi:hypothetical protein